MATHGQAGSPASASQSYCEAEVSVSIEGRPGPPGAHREHDHL